MRKLEINYNPYEMTTAMTVDGLNVRDSDTYSEFAKFIEEGVPLQTWLEPLPYRDWEGFVNELADPEINDKIQIKFNGRKLDFEDLKNILKDQNDERGRLAKVIFSYEYVEGSEDAERAEAIEKAMQGLKNVKDLINMSGLEKIKEEYRNLENKYEATKENKFNIVLAGAYGSGKSTMLNVLMRHTVLPMHSSFYTTKSCKIVHDATLGKGISLLGYDQKGVIVYKRQYFSEDAECAAAVQAICSVQGNSKIAELEFGVNLSHLYPESMNEEQLTIVLRDTPDMDSDEPAVRKINAHAEATLKIIAESNKPMIIFCANKAYRESTCTDEFMREILKQFKEGKSVLKDRFLFLMNKSDTVKFNRNYTAAEAKDAFVNYLTNTAQWSIQGDDADLQELQEEAAKFMPKIFMTAGLVEEAIQNMADHSVEQLKKEEAIAVKAFVEKLLDGTNKSKNYRFADYCDLPNYRKEEISDKFAEASEAYEEEESFANAVKAAHLQTGIVSLEYAIRDYLERYAYPAKIRDLLKGIKGMPRMLDELAICNDKEINSLLEKQKGLDEKIHNISSEIENIKRDMESTKNFNEVTVEEWLKNIRIVEIGYQNVGRDLDQLQDVLTRAFAIIREPKEDFQRLRDELLIKLSAGQKILKDDALRRDTINFNMKGQTIPSSEKFAQLAEKYTAKGMYQDAAEKIAYVELCCVYGMAEIRSNFTNIARYALPGIDSLAKELMVVGKLKNTDHYDISSLSLMELSKKDAFRRLVIEYRDNEIRGMSVKEQILFQIDKKSKLNLFWKTADFKDIVDKYYNICYNSYKIQNNKIYAIKIALKNVIENNLNNFDKQTNINNEIAGIRAELAKAGEEIKKAQDIKKCIMEIKNKLKNYDNK